MNPKTFFRKTIYGKPIIIVSGLPRSGTSMMMKMLEAAGLGIVSDGVRTADDDNPKGYYELERIKDLDKNKDKSWLKDLRGKVVKIISFLLKELPRNNNYKVIFIERNLKEVIASQNKMLTHRQESGGNVSDDKMITNYENHLWKIKYLLRNAPQFQVLYLNHRDVLQKPQEQAAKVNVFLGGTLNELEMAGVVDPNLYRNREEKLTQENT
ncbi:sulfotransferase domain-containing protein [candidate division CSSED10-310 bacterium]|uniref:Sulfotransferase domain-containing protein n=1 Tax=candidate division CSSED10-310 bacterium TaxID=2855610 RepID=A0ABV6YUP9_UNCC1